MCKDGKKITDNKMKADVLNSYFSSVFTEENVQNVPTQRQTDPTSKLESISITKEDICKLLKKINSNKSPGPDGFHPQLLKELAEEISEPLSNIFQKSLSEGTLPTDWKEAQITPLFKKGSKQDPGNYRPVSLTSVVCKILESVIRDKVINHLMTNNLLTSCQHGFVHGRSCTTNLLKTHDDWSKFLDDGAKVDAVYLDFAKAFDSVPHQRLLVKVREMGIDGKVFSWIEQFLKDRKQRVSVDGQLSEWSTVKSGVPQGSVLGPVLFVIYINDLPSVVDSCCIMFADDTKIYNSVNTRDQTEKLQNDINSLTEWSDKWQLRFNADKCKVLHLGKDNQKHVYKMKKHGSDEVVDLQETKLEKDLGIFTDNELKFSTHVEKQVNKGNQLLGLIRRSFQFLDGDTMKTLFVAIVRPHLEFGNAAWAPIYARDKELLEGVQRRATKIVPGLKDLPYEDRLKSLRLPSLTYRRFRGDLIETYKFTHGVYKVSEQMFSMDSSDRTRGHSLKLQKKRCNTTQRQHFFNQRIIEQWNRLPAEIVEAETLNSFKAKIDKHFSANRYSLEEPPTRF